MGLGAGERIHTTALLNISLLIPSYLLREMGEGDCKRRAWLSGRLWRNL